jgi:uncharacterized protein DUF417
MTISIAQSTYPTTRGGLTVRLGGAAARYGLVTVIGWIGLLNFTSFEAHGIQPLVVNSPFMSWVYEVVLSNDFLVAPRRRVGYGGADRREAVVARASAVGSVMAIGLFAVTLTGGFALDHCSRASTPPGGSMRISTDARHGAQVTVASPPEVARD